MPRAPKRQASEEVDDNGAAIETEPENGAAVELPGPAATMDVKIRGNAEAVRAAAAKISREPVAVAEPVDDGADHIGELLADPANMVIVTRVYPPRWADRKTDIRLGKWQCPLTPDDLCADVFPRFGGKKFKAMIHPNTPMGENKVLGAFTIENMETDEPLNEGERTLPIQQVIPNNVDPTLEESDDPMTITREILLTQARNLKQRAEIKEFKRMARDAEDDDPRNGARVNSAAEDRIRALEKDLADERKKREDDRLGRVEAALEKLATAPPKANDNALLIEMMRQNATQFTAMMTAMSKQASDFAAQLSAAKPAAPPAENFDGMLDRVVKLKTALGGGESRTEQLVDLALERLLDDRGASNPEGSVFREVFKEAVPLLRDLVDKLVKREEADKGRKLTVEEAQQYAIKAVHDVAAQWEREGKLVRVGGPTNALPAPAPAPANPQSAPAATKQGEGNGMVKVVDMPGVGKVEVPAVPGAPNYDRKRAVNFVLDSILSEIHEQIPQKGNGDSFAAGDILDHLDWELLDKVAIIVTGPELETLLEQAGADAAKLSAVKEAGKQELVESWLRRVIATVTDEHKRRKVVKA